MQVKNKEQVFNLMDTNGRRADVVNAYTIYMNILNDLSQDYDEWECFPKSLAQYEFYKRAIEASAETFRQHEPYDIVQKLLENPKYNKAFWKKDREALQTFENGQELLKKLDNGVEDRARHYTSNLVKLGFVDNKRRFTTVGKSFFDTSLIEKDKFEELFPLDKINILFLRQLLKLKIFNKDYTQSYSPLFLTIYILLQQKRVSVTILREMIEVLTPYKIVELSRINQIFSSNLTEFEKDYLEFDEVQEGNQKLEFDVFKKYFTNQKSQKQINVYYTFYCDLYDFNEEPSDEAAKQLLSDVSKNREVLNKAFGHGKILFNEADNLAEFYEKNEESVYLNSDITDFNQIIYAEFQASKRYDAFRENGDTFIRLLSVTGIVHFKNGIVELATAEIWEELLASVKFDDIIFQSWNSNEGRFYDKDRYSDFYQNISVQKIFEISDENLEMALSKIKAQLQIDNSAKIPQILKNKVSQDFENFVKEKYNRQTITELLTMFSDRSNDKQIQKIVESTASVPTIYEYVVGIAWYFLSKEKYDLFSSFNLTMNADFIPETHAGGGDGDIVAVYPDKVVMLEVTLMNQQAQKRGEWEPVLRHATNLTIESSPKDVTTLFVADTLDENTINIWRAVASVKMKSSRSDEYAERVKIMPVENRELARMIEGKVDTEKFLQRVNDSFDEISGNFNLGWRDEILANKFRGSH